MGDLSDAERAQVRGGNAAELYGIEVPREEPPAAYPRPSTAKQRAQWPGVSGIRLRCAALCGASRSGSKR